jgi:3-phosphoshikimate 1-carboxyvinyltransferase
MLHNSLAPRPLAAERSPWLRGTLRIPGDTAVALLGLVAAALARGESVVEGAPETDATAAVTRALQALGARVERRAHRWHVTGLGAGGLLEPAGGLDFGGTALGLELVMGLAGIHNFATDFRGNPELSARPLGDLLAGLEAFGVAVTDPDHGRLPLRLEGPKVAVPAALTLPSGAPGTKAALLLAALGAPGVSSFTEPRPTWNHAERMLSRFGAVIEVTAQEGGAATIEVGGLPQLHARQVVVPADPSLAAYGVVAGCIVPASELHFPSLLVNPARTGLFSVLLAMGADISAHALRSPGNEEVADLVVRHAGLKGIVLAAEDVAPLLDELPLLAVAAASAEGETVLHLPPGLPLTEHGRIAAIARGLRANGVAAEATEEALVIVGMPSVRGGGRVVTGRDPAIAMAFLVLGMAAEEQVTIDDQSGIEERFPGFVERFEEIGAGFVRYTE